MTTNSEVALEFLVSYLRATHRAPVTDMNTSLASFRFELWIPNLARAFHTQHPQIAGKSANENDIDFRLSPLLLDAAWDLSLQGILRPSVFSSHNGGGVGNGQGYSVTEQGRKWLNEPDKTFFIFSHPGAYSIYLESFAKLFGRGYEQRAQEALKCFKAKAYLAACVMAGAAAESIILAAAIIRVGEEKAIATYEGRSGTSETTKIITEGVDPRTSKTFDELKDIIKYWRNPSSHGQYADIDEIKAATALTTLVRFAQFMESNLGAFIKR